MRWSIVMTAGIFGGAVACVPGSPIYVGPPLVTLEGHVYVFEWRAPIPYAEVCVFGADTLCVEADRNGQYRAEMRRSMLLEGGAVTVRFRIQRLAPAYTTLHGLEPGEKTTVNCAISNRLTLSNAPMECLPAPDL